MVANDGRSCATLVAGAYESIVALGAWEYMNVPATAVQTAKSKLVPTRMCFFMISSASGIQAQAERGWRSTFGRFGATSSASTTFGRFGATSSASTIFGRFGAT